jgi:hypothetical protein
MNTITLDADLRAKLNGLNERIDVCDEVGKVVGHFIPSAEFQRLLLKDVKVPFTEAQIEQFRKSGGGCTPEEFWKKIGRK